jgi:hypothetical protein
MRFDEFREYRGNCRGMPIEPRSPDDLYQEPEALRAGRDMSFSPVFSGDAFRRAVAYAVIVEGWEKKNAGRVKRAYHAAFTPAERKTLGRWHYCFYRWHLATGTPRRVMLRLKTLTLLRRAVNFFGSIA